MSRVEGVMMTTIRPEKDSIPAPVKVSGPVKKEKSSLLKRVKGWVS